MRGTPRISRNTDWILGIIPAYAGNTNSANPKGFSARDHPRICGEHFTYRDGLTTLQGSSPHMRGTLVEQVTPCGIDGIIPAYAGNTLGCPCPCESDGDHPRICGEHPYRIIPIPEDMGSSPHMRGTLKLGGSGVSNGGIIPAYAGNTCMPNSILHHLRDHPRICGEHLP